MYEMLAPRNHGYVYITPKSAKELTGKYRKRGVSENLIRELNKLFQKLGILGEKRDKAPDGRPVAGWMLNPHDAVCKVYPGACNYLGIGRGRGVWFHRGGASTWAATVNDDLGETCALVDERSPQGVPEVFEQLPPSVPEVWTKLPPSVAEVTSRLRDSESQVVENQQVTNDAEPKLAAICPSILNESNQENQSTHPNHNNHPNDAEGSDVVVGSGGSSVDLDIEEPIAEEPEPVAKKNLAPRRRESGDYPVWLRWMWENSYEVEHCFDEDALDDKQKQRLKAKKIFKVRTNGKDEPIFELLENVHDESLVAIAWATYCTDLAGPWNLSTIYPLAPFLDGAYVDYIAAAKGSFERFKKAMADPHGNLDDYYRREKAREAAGPGVQLYLCWKRQTQHT